MNKHTEWLLYYASFEGYLKRWEDAIEKAFNSKSVKLYTADDFKIKYGDMLNLYYTKNKPKPYVDFIKEFYKKHHTK